MPKSLPTTITIKKTPKRWVVTVAVFRDGKPGGTREIVDYPAACDLLVVLRTLADEIERFEKLAPVLRALRGDDR